MTIPLDRLRDFPLTTPGPGQVAMAVARHAAAVWPSPELYAYAEHRAALIHELIDVEGIPVVSLGETDGAHPREVVEVIFDTAQIVVPSVATLLAAWISRPSKRDRAAKPRLPDPPPRNAPTPLPGIKVKRSDGAELMVTYRDGQSGETIRKLVTDFLADAVPDAPER